MLRRWVALLAASALAFAMPTAARAVSTSGAPDSPLCIKRTGDATAHLGLAGSTVLSPRTTDYEFTSAAMSGTHHVLVTMPTVYDASGATRYPVLYLLHGHGGGARDWFSHGVESIINDNDHPVIVVMPDGGYDGWYSDWYGVDLDGHAGDAVHAPNWETFHINELIPYIDANFPTNATRGGRAIAGLSMGGFGAMSYAARHPELFVAAGSFSGAVDTDLDYPVGGIVTPLAANLPDRKEPDNCIWGDAVTQHDVWLAHDPTALAAHLDGIAMFLSSGNGQPGPHDDPTGVGGEATEFGVWQMNQAFDASLNDAHVEHTTDFYGNGVHAWSYWTAELAKFQPIMDAAFTP